MKKEYRRETLVGEIRLVECRYASGLVEIASYRPAVLPGATSVLCGVADRQSESGKWVACTNRTRAYVGPRKRDAIATIVRYAEAELASTRAS